MSDIASHLLYNWQLFTADVSVAYSASSSAFLSCHCSECLQCHCVNPRENQSDCFVFPFPHSWKNNQAAEDGAHDRKRALSCCLQTDQQDNRDQQQRTPANINWSKYSAALWIKCFSKKYHWSLGEMNDCCCKIYFARIFHLWEAIVSRERKMQMWLSIKQINQINFLKMKNLHTNSISKFNQLIQLLI